MTNKNKAIVCLEFPTESMLLKQFAAPQLLHLAILAFRQVGYEQSKLASHATALHFQNKSFFLAMFSTWVWLRAIHLLQPLSLGRQRHLWAAVTRES